jgi:predicted nucleic acid-binding Zn ribbon protein
LSGVSTFFRHCPNCGKRFEIRLVSKKLVDDRKTEQEVKQAALVPGGLIGGATSGEGRAFGMGGVTYVEENVPLTIDVEDFNYTYRCKHCGHAWTELHEKESKE